MRIFAIVRPKTPFLFYDVRGVNAQADVLIESRIATTSIMVNFSNTRDCLEVEPIAVQVSRHLWVDTFLFVAQIVPLAIVC